MIAQARGVIFEQRLAVRDMSFSFVTLLISESIISDNKYSFALVSSNVPQNVFVSGLRFARDRLRDKQHNQRDLQNNRNQGKDTIPKDLRHAKVSTREFVDTIPNLWTSVSLVVFYPSQRHNRFGRL
jgi:hypothetical protein